MQPADVKAAFQNRRRGFSRYLPLALQLGLLTLAVVLGLWWVIEKQQNIALRSLFTEELRTELENRARIDRQYFDDHVQSLPRAARILIGSSAFIDYVEQTDWSEEAPPIHQQRTPPWLADRTVLRFLLHAKYALLLDRQHHLREVYHHIPDRRGDWIPAPLHRPHQLMRKLSHNQAYLTNLDGAPYVIAAASVDDDSASILLAAPLDDHFLRNASGLFEHQHIMALIDPAGDQIVACSTPDLIAHGANVSQVRESFLMIGKSFFDYGASDLDLVFASFIPLERANRITDTVVKSVAEQRLIMVVALLFAFLMMITIISMRVRRLTERVSRFTSDNLATPLQPERLQWGDELAALNDEFASLSGAVLSYQEHLNAQADARIELNRQKLISEQQAREVEWLQSLTETLGIGILILRDGRWTPFNPLMKRTTEQLGAVAPLLPGEESTGGELELKDRDGESHVFTFEHHTILGFRAYLYRDITEERRVRKQLEEFASFPDVNPSPVLRVSMDGTLLYINAKGAEQLGSEGLHIGGELPTAWRKRVQGAIREEDVSNFMLQVGNRCLSFTPVMEENSSSFYIFSRDITEEKRAEEELKTAAMVAEHVLDSVMVTDPDGVILQVNPAFTQITGYSEEDAIGHTPALLRSHHHDDAFYQHLWLELATHYHWRGEIWNRRKNGEVFPAQISINAIRNSEGQIVKFVGVMVDITENKNRERQLSHLAYRDPLTDLPNRLLLMDRLQQAIVDADRENTSLAVLFIDLDGFKAINDNLGHDMGDLLLQEVAERLKQSVRAADTVSRLGGDEFVVILRNIHAQRRDAVEVTEKILRKLAAPYILNEHEGMVSASIGVALYPSDGNSGEILMKKADEAMYQAKQQGKNRYFLNSPSSVRTLKGV